LKNYRQIVQHKMQIQGGKCGVCGKPLSFLDFPPPQLAHRIPKTKSFVAQYGKDVIDHPINLVLVCSLACNDAVLIGAARPVERERLAAEIRGESQNSRPNRDKETAWQH